MSFEKFFFKKPKNPENTSDAYSKETVLNKIRKLNSRNLLLTMAFVSGLNYAARAEKSEKISETKIFKSEVINFPDRVEFQAVNYFASDSDFISKEAEEKIGIDFKKLLDQVNDGNYKQIIEDGIYVYSSADPEKTNNFKDNEALARARAESLIKLLKEQLGSINFSNLSPEKSKEFTDNIKFFVEIPTSSVVSNPQTGVTYPEDLGYSEEVLSNISSEEMDKIYSKCRKVVVSLGIYKSDTYHLSSKDFDALSNKNYNDIHNEVKVDWKGNDIVLLIDNSPSVGDYSYQEILEKIMNDQDLVDKKIQLAFFSNKLGQTFLCDNVNKVIKMVGDEDYNGNGTEQMLSSTLSKIISLPKPENNNSTTIKAFTDENLQNVSLNMMDTFKQKSKEKMADVNFYYVDKDYGLMQITVDELQIAIENELLREIGGFLRQYINDKNKEISSTQDKNNFHIQSNLDKLSKALDDKNLTSVLNNPLINEAYKNGDAKGLLVGKKIKVVSLKNIGHRVSINKDDLASKTL